jgi:hypothetical protein
MIFALIFALWMIWVGNNSSGAAHIGDFTSLDECKMAANSQQHVGPEQNAPNYSFICVRSK